MNILRSLPFFTVETHIASPAGMVKLLPYQIAVTVSLVVKGNATRPFPAVLDTGLNQSFALTESHLEQWLGFKAAQLRVWGSTVVMGQSVLLREAKVGIHPNVPGQAAIAAKEPFALSTREAILVFPAGPYPRLPLLGLRALVDSNLRLSVDGSRKLVQLRTAGFLSWLGIG